MSMNEERLYAVIGERLKRIRVGSGIPQSRLAAAIDHLRTSISNIESGRQRAPLHVLYELCYQLGIELTTILPMDHEVREVRGVAVTLRDSTEELPPNAAAAVQEILRANARMQ
jgi:transcriptional regulator with XRE-family HTH domain